MLFNKTRTTLLASVFLAFLASAACRNTTPFTVVSFGGAYQAAQHNAYIQPFGQSTGVKIQEAEYNGEYGLLRERAVSPQGSWDVVSVESGPCMRGGKDGIFLQLPDSVFQGTDLVVGARRPYAAGHLVFSTILAYDHDAITKSKASPGSWADFWDVKRFPGKRGLRNNPRGSLEIALLADGVDPAKLYPLDVKRAFAKLDQLRPNLVFWDSGAQPIQLLANKTVTMSSVYNGRVWDAIHKENLPLETQFNQGLMEIEFWAVPKNSPNPETAMRFIAYSLQPDKQAAFVNATSYGPTNRSAMPNITPSLLNALPSSPEQLPRQIPVNAEWWAENEAQASAQWDQWRQQK